MKLKWFNAVLSGLMLGVALSDPVQAGIVRSDPIELAGTWTGIGNVIIVNDYGAGIMAVHGIDSDSSFECTGRRIGNALTCAGFGVQQSGNKLFTYSSRFELQGDGSLSEKWEAVWEDSGNPVLRNGTMSYRRGLRVVPAAAGEEMR